MTNRKYAEKRNYKPFYRLSSKARSFAIEAIFEGTCNENREALKIENTPVSRLSRDQILYWAKRQMEYYQLTEGDNEYGEIA